MSAGNVPWEIADCGHGREVLREVGPRGRALFEIRECPGLGRDAERIRATVAAAPELLSELESAALALEESAKLLFAKGLQGCASIMTAHAEKARATIAKATSESSLGRVGE